MNMSLNWALVSFRGLIFFWVAALGGYGGAGNVNGVFGFFLGVKGSAMAFFGWRGQRSPNL